MALAAFVVALVGLLATVFFGLGALGSLSNDHTGPAQVVRILFPVWAVLSLILGILGRSASRSRGGRGRGLSTAAIVIAVIEIVLAAWLVLLVTSCLNDVYHCR
jgi:hypothetical protein